MNAPVRIADATIERRYDAIWLNRIANDPAVLPWVKGWRLAPLDLSAVAADRNNICLCGEHGAMIFHEIQPGLMETHAMCLQRGRGKWMLSFAMACELYVFTRTNCVELLARCPFGNLGVISLARALGWTKEFTNPRGWVIDGDPVPATIAGLRLQDWARTAPGLVERGHWVAERLNVELDAEAERFTGLAMEMLLGGQPLKGLIFFNRWASLADYPIMRILTLEPLAVEIAGRQIIVRPETQDFWLVAAK